MFDAPIFGPVAPSALGDNEGFTIGHATNSQPVLFGPSPADDSPPVCTIVGDAGSGKTFLSFVLACQAARAGMSGIYIGGKEISRTGLAGLVDGEVRNVPSRHGKWDIIATENSERVLIQTAHEKLADIGGGMLILDGIQASDERILIDHLMRQARSEKITVVVTTHQSEWMSDMYKGTRVALRQDRHNHFRSGFKFLDEEPNSTLADWMASAADIPRGVVKDGSGRVGRLNIGPLSPEFLDLAAETRVAANA